MYFASYCILFGILVFPLETSEFDSLNTEVTKLVFRGGLALPI